MSGGSDKHSEIAVNCTTEISLQLRGKKCRTFNSDMKVKISKTRDIYPDFSVVCGDAKFADESNTMLINPTLVAEITSPNSAGYDRTTKYDFYRKLPSVQTYLIINQERFHVQIYQRQENGWFFQEFEALEDIIALDSIGCKLPVAEIYRDIDFKDGEATDIEE